MRLSEILTGYFGGDDRDERVRRKLVETLYTHPISLLLGALCGVAASWTAAVISGDQWVFACAVALTTVAAARVALAYWIAYVPRARDARWSGSTRSARSASRSCQGSWRHSPSRSSSRGTSTP